MLYIGGATALVSARWGIIPMVVKKASQAIAHKLPRASRERRRQSDVPRRLQTTSLRDSGLWLLRMDQKAGRSTAVLHPRRGRRGPDLRRLWDKWKNPEIGESVISCTIIVTDANELTRPIHDRMPVVLDKADIGRWLSGEAGTELLRPAAEERLRMWPVSRRVNKTGSGDDDPTLVNEGAG